MRNMLFVSHANPENNGFALWLSLQLAKDGYPVWCDLTKLLCGEKFWDDIQDAIGNRSVKFIFVVSRQSNAKDGPKDELQCAVTAAKNHGLADFILPVAIDDLPVDQYYIPLLRRNVRSFRDGWAQGLAGLLEKLEKDMVPKNPNFTPECVSKWWREQFHKDCRELETPEEYLSNYFEITALPEKIYLHKVCMPATHSTESRRRAYASSLPYPAVLHGDYVISFADTEAFLDANRDIIYAMDKNAVGTRDFKAGKSAAVPHRDVARNIIINLMGAAWNAQMKAKDIPYYEMSDTGRCYYFLPELSDKKRHPFKDRDGKTKSKALHGASTTRTFKYNEETKKTRFWHFGIQARPILSPVAGFALRYHVLFSDDGKNIWNDRDKMHRARRSQCKDWWNDDWRDRLLAFMHMLRSGAETMPLPLGPETKAEVSLLPVTFLSPVSYLPPESPVRSDEAIGDSDDEDDVHRETDGEIKCETPVQGAADGDA